MARRRGSGYELPLFDQLGKIAKHRRPAEPSRLDDVCRARLDTVTQLATTGAAMLLQALATGVSRRAPAGQRMRVALSI
jgi:hypothetical protein